MNAINHTLVVLFIGFMSFSCGSVRYAGEAAVNNLRDRIMTPERIDSLLKGAPRPIYKSNEEAVSHLYSVVPTSLIKSVSRSGLKKKTWQMVFGETLLPFYVTFSNNKMIVEGVSEDSIILDELEYYLSDTPDIQIRSDQKKNKKGRFLICHREGSSSNDVSIVFFYEANPNSAEITFVTTPFNGTILVAAKRPSHKNKKIKRAPYAEYPEGTIFIR